MFIGLMLGGFRGSPAAFNPATLSSTGWWRGSYAGAPWAGTASAGASGTRAIESGGAPPTAGTAVDTYTPALCNGTTNFLQDNDLYMDSYLSTTAYAITLMIRPTAAAVHTTIYDNPGVFTEAGGNFGVVFSDQGVSVYHVSAMEVQIACPINVWSVIDIRFSGGTIEIRRNGGAWTSAAAVATGAIGSPTGALRVGTNYANAARFTGSIMEIITNTSTRSDGDFNNIYSYLKARYPSAGLP